MTATGNELTWKSIEGKPGIAVLENFAPNNIALSSKIQEAIAKIQAIDEFLPQSYTKG